MSVRRSPQRPGPNRLVFYAIVGLAVLIILCALVTPAVGWTRLCGGGLAVVGGVLLLLAEDKRWPALIVLAGLALFFADTLLGTIIPEGP